nr:NS factory [Largemouth bass reovirus]
MASSNETSFSSVSDPKQYVCDVSKPITMLMQYQNHSMTVTGSVPNSAKSLIPSNIYMRLGACILRDNPDLHQSQLSHFTLLTKLRKHPAALKLGVTSVHLLVSNATKLLNEIEGHDVEVFIQEEAALTEPSVDPTAILAKIVNPETLLSPALEPAVQKVFDAAARRPATPPTLPNTGVPKHLGMENDRYNMTRFLFMRGEIYDAKAFDDEVNQEFCALAESSLPRIADDGSSPNEVNLLPVVCSKHENLSLLTPLNVVKTATKNIYELCDGDVTLAVIKCFHVEDWIPIHMRNLHVGPTSTPFTAELGRLNCITPGALKYMVERKESDGIVNQADTRWVLGLDPLFADCWPGMKILMNVLFDHKSSVWSAHNKASVRAGLLEMDDEMGESRTQLARMCYKLVGPDKWYSAEGVYSKKGKELMICETYDRVRLVLKHGAVKDQEALVTKDMFEEAHKQNATQMDMIRALEAEREALRRSLDVALRDVTLTRSKLEKQAQEHELALTACRAELERMLEVTKTELLTQRADMDLLQTNIQDMTTGGFLMCVADQATAPRTHDCLMRHWEQMAQNSLSWREHINMSWRRTMEEAVESATFDLANEYDDKMDALKAQVEQLKASIPMKPTVLTASSPNRLPTTDDEDRSSVTSTSSGKKVINWSHASRRQAAHREVYDGVKEQRQEVMRSLGWGDEGDERIFGERSTTERVSHGAIVVSARPDSDDDWSPDPGASDI